MLAAGSRFNDDEDFCTNRAVLNAAWLTRAAGQLIFLSVQSYEELIGMAPPIDEELEQMERKVSLHPLCIGGCVHECLQTMLLRHIHGARICVSP